MQSSSWLFAFMLFNFQGPVLFVHRSELVYYITLFSACQALFSKFFNFFLKPKFQSKSLVFGLLMSFLSSRVLLSRWQLIYNIMPKLICQHLFWYFFKKNQKKIFSPFSTSFCSAKPSYLSALYLTSFLKLFIIKQYKAGAVFLLKILWKSSF